jgi:hypothetical protein
MNKPSIKEIKKSKTSAIGLGLRNKLLKSKHIDLNSNIVISILAIPYSSLRTAQYNNMHVWSDNKPISSLSPKITFKTESQLRNKSTNIANNPHA